MRSSSLSVTVCDHGDQPEYTADACLPDQPSLNPKNAAAGGRLDAIIFAEVEGDIADLVTCHMQIVLRGAGELFCGVECERRYSVRAGGGALRRALYALERGVCQLCRLDCKHLLERLRWTPAGDLIQSLIIAYGHGLRCDLYCCTDPCLDPDPSGVPYSKSPHIITCKVQLTTQG